VASPSSESGVARVALTLTGDGIATPLAQDVPHATGAAWQALVESVPTGGDRTISIVAFDGHGAQVASESVDRLAIGSAQPTVVAIMLDSTPGKGPRIDHVVASSVADGWALRAAAHSSIPIGFVWSASEGTFDDATSATPSWRAPNTGDSELRLVAKDFSGAFAGVSFMLAGGNGGGNGADGGNGGGGGGGGGGSSSSSSTSSGGGAGPTGSASVTATMNTWPIVDLVNATPTRIDVGGTTALTTTAHDPDGDPLGYAWSAQCTGSFDNASSPTPRFLLAAAPAQQTCALVVSVTDGKGGSNQGTFSIQTGAPPPVQFAPVIDSTFQSATKIGGSGQVTLRVLGHATDNSALVFGWSAVVGTLGTATSTATSSQIIWTAPATFGTGTITHVVATVRDVRGNVTPVDFQISGGP
jgi:hypothetical protein